MPEYESEYLVVSQRGNSSDVRSSRVTFHASDDEGALLEAKFLRDHYVRNRSNPRDKISLLSLVEVRMVPLTDEDRR